MVVQTSLFPLPTLPASHALLIAIPHALCSLSFFGFYNSISLKFQPLPTLYHFPKTCLSFFNTRFKGISLMRHFLTILTPFLILFSYQFMVFIHSFNISYLSIDFQHPCLGTVGTEKMLEQISEDNLGNISSLFKWDKRMYFKFV